MNDQLKQRFDHIESKRKEMIGKIRAMTPEDQQRIKEGQAMSPAAVVQHFVIVEGGNARFLHKRPTKTLTGTRLKLGMFYQKTVDSMKNPAVTAPTLPFFIPKGAIDLERAVADFDAIRDVFRSNLEDCPSPDAPFIKMMFFFGTLSGNQYLDLIEVHQDYHLARLA